ncbi:MAG TPA: LON peptidase substrate-binding domain-containing protein, partial [Candidatus Hodarchaeales archaeon]|nr:LON peptidase substrate-binding domain-containing protein [Candidatus Hodarchaeales archaeon]
IGTIAQVISQELFSDGRSHIIVRGIERVRIGEYFRPYSSNDYPIAEASPIDEGPIDDTKPIWQGLREELLVNLRRFFDGTLNSKDAGKGFEKLQSLSTDELINNICQFFTFELETRLVLLEKPSYDRGVFLGELLLDAIRFYQ